MGSKNTGTIRRSSTATKKREPGGATNRNVHSSRNERSTLLEIELRKLDAVFAKHERQIYEDLSPPATARERNVLAGQTLREPALPSALDTWFAWHNGGNDYCLLGGYRPLSTMEAVLAYDRLRSRGRRLGRPWRASWLPLFQCAGLFLLYETEPPNRGALLKYDDDLTRCPVAAPSLLVWARRLRSQVEKRVRAASTRPRLGRAKFERVGVPGLKELRSAPIGALYHHACSLYSGAPGERVYVKIGPNAWQWLQDSTLDGALSSLTRQYSEARGGRNHTDRTLAESLETDLTAGVVLERAFPRQVSISANSARFVVSAKDRT